MITEYNVFVPSIMGSGSSLRTGLELKKRGCKKALVVFDKGLKAVGISDKVVENLQNAGIETVDFDGVLPDPPDTVVEGAAEMAKEKGIDCIVAIGGGSSMDTAKGINVLMNNPPPIMKYFGVQKNLKPGVPLIFIPTTSGTGSEVTNMCVISCESLGKKDSVISDVCVGTLAILDPELTLGLPPKLTAATGVDALSHAVESLTGGHSNPLSDALARDAIRTIAKWLPVAYEDGSNIEARENLLYASMFAGMAFTNALVHVGHAIGHTLGAKFHIPHGTAVAISLPEVIEYAAKTEHKKVRMICEALGIQVPDDATPEEIGELGKNALRKLIKSVDIPNLKDLGISLEDAMGTAPMASQDAGLALAPYRITGGKIADIIKSAYDA